MDPRYMRRALGIGQFDDPYQKIEEARNPPQRPTSPFSMRPAEGDEDEDQSLVFLRELERVRGPMPMTSAYRREVLGGAPLRENYQPGKMTRLAAGLSGMSAGYKDAGKGITTAMGVNETPWRNAYDDYISGVERLGKGAALEGDEGDFRVKQMMLARSMGIDAAKLEQQRDYQTQTAATARYAAETARMKLDDPDWEKYDTPSGVQFWNKKNPNDRMLVPGKTVAGMQAEAAQQNARSNAANAASNSHRAGIYGRDVDSRIEDRTRRQQMAKEVLELKVREGAGQPGGTKGKGTPQYWTAREQSDAREVALRDLLTDPDYGQYVEEPDDPNGFLTFGDDVPQDFKDELQDRIDEILSRQKGPVK